PSTVPFGTVLMFCDSSVGVGGASGIGGASTSIAASSPPAGASRSPAGPSAGPLPPPAEAQAASGRASTDSHLMGRILPSPRGGHNEYLGTRPRAEIRRGAPGASRDAVLDAAAGRRRRAPLAAAIDCQDRR